MESFGCVDKAAAIEVLRELYPHMNDKELENCLINEESSSTCNQDNIARSSISKIVSGVDQSCSGTQRQEQCGRRKPSKGDLATFSDNALVSFSSEDDDFGQREHSRSPSSSHSSLAAPIPLMRHLQKSTVQADDGVTQPLSSNKSNNSSESEGSASDRNPFTALRDRFNRLEHGHHLAPSSTKPSSSVAFEYKNEEICDLSSSSDEGELFTPVVNANGFLSTVSARKFVRSVPAADRPTRRKPKPPASSAITSLASKHGDVFSDEVYELSDSDEEFRRSDKQRDVFDFESSPYTPQGACGLTHYTTVSERRPVTKMPSVSSSTSARPPFESSILKPCGLNVALKKSQSEPTAKSNDTEFLKGLSDDCPAHRRHPDAALFIQQFKAKLSKDQLTARLFKIYNARIFDNKLPGDLKVSWNPRLTKTAGFCYYRSERNGENAARSVRIELSEKVCDSAERVRDVLLHELCHAAVFIINGVKGAHCAEWRYWAYHSCRVFTCLPPIRRCHNYEIKSKYTYKCSQCSQHIHRHSKSLDLEAKVCGLCKGKFRLFLNKKDGSSVELLSSSLTPAGTPAVEGFNSIPGMAVKTPSRQLNAFALFVKENYGSTKKPPGAGAKALSHKETMDSLGKEFAKLKTKNE